VRCILPTSGHDVQFDDEGVCSICTSASKLAGKSPHLDSEAQEKQKQAELEKRIDRIRERGKGHAYDCLVGVSGGRDSSYLLHLLVTQHNLRCLAAYYRTPFTVDGIDANVRRMTRQLNVPLVEMNVSAEYHRRIARDMVVLWKRKPLPVIANMACAPCKFVNREAFRICRQHDIQAIIYGGNPYEIFQLSAGQLQDVDKDKKHTLGTQTLEALAYAKRGAKLLLRCASMWRYVPLGVRASFMYRCPHTVYLRLRYPEIERLEYFFYAPWDEKECHDALAALGWELPEGCNATWKADCTFAEVKNVMFRATTGVTYMDALISNMVRENVLSRDEALRRIEAEGAYSAERARDALTKMGLPLDFLGDTCPNS
jgi:hypothetical protein